MSLSRFDPRLIEVWRRGAQQTVDLKLDKRSEAIRLRYQLYSLRKALIADNNPVGELAKRATIRLLEADKAGKYHLLVEPAGNKLKHVLDEAGIDLPGEDDIENMDI